MRRTELAISGMTCASCVAHVTKALQSVPGVRRASVHLVEEQALVEHEASVLPSALVAAVAEAGYGAKPLAENAGPADEDAQRREAEIAGKKKRLVFGLSLFVPTLLVGMFAPPFPGKDWLLLALTIPVWAGVGWEFHRGAIAQAKRFSANMDTLVSLGSTAALALSLDATLAGRPTYYETASAIVSLVFVGKYLEAQAKGRSGQALRALLRLRPATARIVASDGGVREVSVEEVNVGDLVLVPPGERIAVDGVVEEGRSAINMAMLTGEPIPREAGPGTEVRAGTLNGDGSLRVRASAVGAGTTLARIVETVRRAQASAPSVQRRADAIAAVFVPAILLVAAGTFLVWLLRGHPWWTALVPAVAVLVVSCPCALGLATPVAIVVGVGLGAQRGVLFRDAAALEALGAVDTVIFDKTGTLTLGRPAVTSVRPAEGSTEEEVLRISAAVERASSHPLAAAIVRAAEERRIAFPPAQEHQAQRGLGARAYVDAAEALIGTRRFLEAGGVASDAFAALESGRRADATLVFAARAGRLLGAIELADPLRPQARDALERLRALGVETRLVSGDATGAVEAVAARLGIAQWNAQVSPEGKAEIVQALRAARRRVAFIGDGINDAPALAGADVGLAMGAGTEIALETASAAIISDDPAAAASAIALARAVMRTIAVNLFWAFAYNVALIPLAAVNVVHPVMAAGAMGLSSLFVVGNSLLLRRYGTPASSSSSTKVSNKFTR